MIEIERRINAPTTTVFSYFTDSSLYSRWMGVEAQIDARPGGIYRVLVPQGTHARGTFSEVDPPNRLVFTWGWEGSVEVPPGSSRVEITLTPDGDGTILRLVHSGLPNAGSISGHTEGWERYLDRLGTVTAGGDPGADTV